jgi:hypothetical protein
MDSIKDWYKQRLLSVRRARNYCLLAGLGRKPLQQPERLFGNIVANERREMLTSKTDLLQRTTVVAKQAIAQFWTRANGPHQRILFHPSHLRNGRIIADYATKASLFTNLAIMHVQRGDFHRQARAGSLINIYV